MSRPLPPSPKLDEAPTKAPAGDPWHAFGYLVSGVLVYAVIGWLVDRWLGTSLFVVIGILAGAALGLYMTWSRFNKPYSVRRHESSN